VKNPAASIMMLAIFGLLMAGCVRITDEEGHRVNIGFSEKGFAGTSNENMKVQENILKALVKGSIYESGEFVSVFGTCLNVTDGGFPGSYASMSSWYPNGTLFFENVSMTEIQTGYFVYTGNMSAVQGTYLTELLCHVNSSDEVAKAFGEWQNPFWVSRIETIEGLSNQTLNEIFVAQTQIANLSEDVSGGFNITYSKIDNISILINSTSTNLTNLILYAAGVANASVDRNDSYLALLLQAIASSVGTPITQNLTIVEEAGNPVYLKTWRIDLTVYNEYNNTIGDPLVSCFINTTNPNTVGEAMNFLGNGIFRHQEQVRTLPGVDFSWTYDCHYN
jgi:hypothetical protein